MTRRLIQNAAQCFDCGSVIQSFSVHDFRSCKCGNIFVDGGLEYTRFGWINDNWMDLSEYEGDDDQ